MIEKSKKHKKGIISEEDISTLLQRYTANTVLALLQEVAQFGGVKIDWSELVKKTTTGISCVREYQMLWRHLAYRHALLEKLEDEAQPLEDDSDLEYELEAFPDVSSEASAEAAACVKVLIASGLPSDSSHPNSTTVEAPLTINVPNGQLVRATSENSQLATMRGMNITIPVSVQKQPLPSVMSTGALDINGLVTGTIPARRKRKPWTEAEDLELVAAVQKYGEGNWANILRSEFKWDRTASQLSQRWAIIRKRIGNLNLGGSTSGVQLSEAQQAARVAMNLALQPPVKNTFINNSGEGTSAQYQSQLPFTKKSSSVIQLGSAAKSQISVNKPVKPDLRSDPVRAAAVAAGARIASQSDAASLIRAAQAMNSVHIIPTGGSSIKSSLPGGASSHSEANSNVLFNGLPTASVSTHPAVSSSVPRPASEKASSPTTHRNPISDPAGNVSSAKADAELLEKQDTVTTRGVKIPSDVVKVQVQERSARILGNEPSKQVKQEKAVLPKQEIETKTQASIGESSNIPTQLEVAGCDMAQGKQAEGSHNLNGDNINCPSVKKDENQSEGEVNGEIQIAHDNNASLPSLATDDCCEKLENARKEEPGNAKVTGEES